MLLLEIYDLDRSHLKFGRSLQGINLPDGLDEAVLFLSGELGVESTIFLLFLDEGVEGSFIALHLVESLSDVGSTKLHPIILQVTNHRVELLFIDSHGFLH